MNIKRKIRRLIGLIYDYYLAIRISFMSKEDKFLYIYKTEYWKGEGNAHYLAVDQMKFQQISL